jgi:DMSO/TMAO reductase YedYZ molybdopterin-dependent catalytic subunit
MQLKKISVILTITLIIAIAAALSGCTNTASGGLSAGLPDSMDFNVQVSGGATPVTLSYSDLKAMELNELKGVTTVNSVGTETSGDFIGVPLMDIVEKAGLPSGEVSFKVTASDGYSIDYTQEQFTAGIIALKTNGAALNNNINDDNNCIRMVIPGELKNMWLKMPVKIEITGGAAKPIALSISGANVTTKKNYALDDLTAMTQKTIMTTGKDNATKTYTGVSLNALLDAVGPRGDYVQFISGDEDNYNKTVALSIIRDSPDAIIAIDENGELKDIIPGQSTGVWVGNLTKIRID